MLYIQTDLKDINWLRYILDEFTLIQDAKFKINIIGNDIESTQNNVIFYNCRAKGEVSIFCSDQVSPTGKIEYLTEKLYVIKHSSSKGLTVNYDLLWNAFVFLSRYEEYLSEKNGKCINSYSLRHPREDKNSFDIPIVNLLFNELEYLIKQFFPNLKFGKQQKKSIELSHDVDYIEKTIQLRIKQTAFNLFNALKSLSTPSSFLSNIVKTIYFLFSNPSYWCFDYWKKLESKHGVKSIYYIYVKNGKKNFKSWLIDPSYDISTNIKLQETLKKLKKEGFDIGLHGSYESARSFEQLKNEKEILERCLGFQITKTRQHWLNYYEKITPYSHEKLFKFDSTLGWNDRIGFRSGIASKYRPYDHNNKRAFNYIVTPQVIMDSNVYEYSDKKNIFSNARNILKNAEQQAKAPCFSISWHQRVCCDDYKWHYFYKEYICDM